MAAVATTDCSPPTEPAYGCPFPNCESPTEDAGTHATSEAAPDMADARTTTEPTDSPSASDVSSDVNNMVVSYGAAIPPDE